MYSLLGLLLAASACALNRRNHHDADPPVVYEPARPPSIPLAVRSPYTSVWSSTRNGGTLNTNGVEFWTGQKVGWEGIIVVDGIAYEWMGTSITDSELPELDNFRPATPLYVGYDSQNSNFTFTAGPVLLNARFFSPVVPQDLCRTSVPLSYLEVSYTSRDNRVHDVQLYMDVDNSWNNYQASADITAGLNVDAAGYDPNTTVTRSTLFTWWYHLTQEFYFSELNDFPQWGNMTFSTQPGQAENFTFASGKATDTRYNFIQHNRLSNHIGFDDSQVFAFSHDMKSKKRGSVLYTVGVIQNPVINLLTSEGLQSLDPWWSSDGCFGPDFANLIATHYYDFANVQEMATAWDEKLQNDVHDYYVEELSNPSSDQQGPSTDTGYAPLGPLFPEDYESGIDQFGEKWIFNSSNSYGYMDANTKDGIAAPDVPEDRSYYSIVALSARQIMGAYVLTIPPNFGCGERSTMFSPSEPFLMQKEISSNGNIQTVDVLYPTMPFFLYANPNLLKYALNPLYMNQESGFYPRPYSMHDLGTHFPNATGHTDAGDEQMPVEESGNMILMTYAYYKFTGDTAYLHTHYPLLTQWATYLLATTLTPTHQLSTDDFAGALPNNTNLALKGILALTATSRIAAALSLPADTTAYLTTARSHLTAWQHLAIAPTGTHALLSYHHRASWSLLYNLFPDRLLALSAVPAAVYAMQSAHYPRVAQQFGVPLDSRASLAKSDWQLWAAAACAPPTRRLIVGAVARWLNDTRTDRPLADLYETAAGDGGYPDAATFAARPVVGGHFALLAMGRAGYRSGTGFPGTGEPEGGGNGTGTVAPVGPGGTEGLPVLEETRPASAPSVVVSMGTWEASGVVSSAVVMATRSVPAE